MCWLAEEHKNKNDSKRQLRLLSWGNIHPVIQSNDGWSLMPKNGEILIKINWKCVYSK